MQNQSNTVSNGTIIVPNEGRYEGQLLNNLPHGEGRMYMSDGGTYIGSFLNGYSHGEGTHFDPHEKRMCSGTYKKGRQNGEGIVRINGKLSYKGLFKDGKHFGKGSMTFPDGTVCEGFFEGDFVNGEGKIFGIDIDYEGNLMNNQPNGKGKMTWKNGNTYVGSFINGSASGKGTITSMKGKIYLGGILSGLDKKTFGYGYTIKGEFKDGKSNGRGKLITFDGYIYRGQFKNSLRHGKGKQTFPNGIVNIGYFANDEFCGNITEDRSKWLECDQERGIRKKCISCMSTYSYRLYKCGKCMKARYCNATCQHKDWSQHKLECI
jgi:hypothetical protein